MDSSLRRIFVSEIKDGNASDLYAVALKQVYRKKIFLMLWKCVISLI